MANNNGSMFPSIAGGVASGIASAGLNYAFNRALADDEQKNYERNTKMNYDLAQRGQRDAMSNFVNGARMAGINPASVAGQSSVSAVGNSAPLQNKSSQPVNFPIGELNEAYRTSELLKAQKANVEANTNKTQAEAHNLGIEGEKSALELQYQKDYNENFALELEAQNKELWQSYVASVRKNNPEATEDDIRQGFTPGVLIGHVGYNEKSLELMKNFNEKKIQQAISANPRYAKSLAAMPSAEVDKITADIAYTKALEDTQSYLQGKIEADTTLSKAEVSKIEADIIKIGQDIEESVARIDRMTSEKVRNYGMAVSSGVGALTDLIELGTPAGAIGSAAKGAKGAYKTKETYRQTKSGYTKTLEHFPIGD